VCERVRWGGGGWVAPGVRREVASLV